MKILIVLTSYDQLGNTGRKTGFWLEEFAAPYYTFLDAGATVTLASPKGGQPPLDPVSDTPEGQTELTRRFKQDPTAQAVLAHTLRLSDVTASDYDAVFYPGGHGPMWDLAEDPHSIALIEAFYSSGKPVAAVCHAPGVLHRVKFQGQPIVKGKRVTGFTNGEEEAVHLTKVVPFLVEDELKRLGGLYEKGANWVPFVVTDGRLVTGQNPASSKAGAEALLNLLSPDALTPARFIDRFEQMNGVHAGFRRNHAKGLGVSGFFESNGNGIRLSKAAVFASGRVPVIGRFSLDGGQPYQPDRPDTRRGLGLQFSLPNGELWRTAMINFPLFPVRTPEIFYERLRAFKQDLATGQPDPALVKAFEERHPETVEVLKKITAGPQASGFGTTTFHGLNAFLFTNAAGKTTPVRWILTPMQPFEAAGAVPPDKNYLFDDLITQIHRQPLHWRLIVIVGQPGDPTNDPSIGWPADREQVDVGTLTLDRVEAEELSAATDIIFNPLMLPAGMAPSDDPVIRVRSAAYVESYTRRAGETKQPSAITPADVKKGE
jgi:catalase